VRGAGAFATHVDGAGTGDGERAFPMQNALPASGLEVETHSFSRFAHWMARHGGAAFGRSSPINRTISANITTSR
jgi:hypothetical protein